MIEHTLHLATDWLTVTLGGNRLVAVLLLVILIGVGLLVRAEYRRVWRAIGDLCKTMSATHDAVTRLEGIMENETQCRVDCPGCREDLLTRISKVETNVQILGQ